MAKVLLIEDDENICVSLGFTLKHHGYEMIYVNTVKDSLKIIENNDLNLILLDKNLPDGDGISLCKKIRERFSVPIIFISAVNTEIDMVNALTMGADDYITKPFAVSFLIAKIKSVLRRFNKTEKEKVIKSKEIIYHKETGKVTKNGENILLNKRELELLRLFMYNPKSILSKEKILNNIWDTEGEFVDENIISVNIRRLRKKIEDTPSKPAYIITIRGLGYMWKEGCEYL